MPEHLRALIIIIILAAFFFAVGHRSIVSIIDHESFSRRRNLWFYLTITAFVSNNFWLYLVIAIPLLIFNYRRETNPPALFFFILFILPSATINIPGMGLVNYIFDISHTRILEMCILLPAFIFLKKQNDTPPFGRNGTDKFLAFYLLMSSLLPLRETTVTDTMRHAFYLFIDVFLPYYVMSRSLKNLQMYRDAMMSFVIATMIVGLLAIFETYRHWLLYDALLETLKLDGIRGYLGRDGILRAAVTAGQSIPLGYIMSIGFGFFLYIKLQIKGKKIRWLGMLLLLAGLIAPFSRGPWVGAAVLYVVFTTLGRNAIRNLISLATVALILLTLTTLLPGGEKIINLLPFIGTTESGNIDYREKLFTNSVIVIQRNPWFGSTDYLSAPEMQVMRQGQGIIDIVNSYLQVTLSSGFVGLGLFISIFSWTLWGVFRATRSIQVKRKEEYLLGQTLLATLLAIMVTIFTVSSITVIPVVYWSVTGLAVGYIRLIKTTSGFKERI